MAGIIIYSVNMIPAEKNPAYVSSRTPRLLASVKSNGEQYLSLPEASDLELQMLSTVYRYVLECHARKVGVGSPNTPEIK